MAPCKSCGKASSQSRVLDVFETDLFGIPAILHNAVIVQTCGECGFETTAFIDPEGIEAALAMARLAIPVALSGAEIRFLRKACRMTSGAFAKLVDVDKSTLSRWENAAPGEGHHGSSTDKTIRDVVWGMLYRKVPAITITPGTFSAMRLVAHRPVTIALERVRFKDYTGVKSDQWDTAA